jgi:hypothetical protein
LKLHIFEVNVVIDVIKQNRIIRCIEYGSPYLDLKRSFEFIRAYQFLDIDQHAALNPFVIRKFITRPCPAIDKFIKGALQGLKYLAVGSLNLLAANLHAAPEFLGFSKQWDASQEENTQTLYHWDKKLSKY